MPEPYLRSKSSSSSGRSSRSSSSRKSGSSRSSSSSRKSSSSKTKATASKKKAATKKKAAQKKPIGARPALLYGLVLACAVAVGAISIQAIHASTPVIDGFESTALASTNNPTGTSEADGPVAPPVAAELMRKQGWVAPASVEIYERKRNRSELPPEIAAVPETLIESEVIKPEGGGYAPPPPIAGAIGAGGTLAGQTFPSDQAVPIQGGDPTAQSQPQNGDQIQSMLAGINNQQRQPEPAKQPSQRTNQRVTLLQAQAQCANKGFIARIACNDRVREEFCSNRWNEIDGCEREEDANF